MNTFLRGFGAPNPDPAREQALNVMMEADIILMLKFMGDWQSEHELRKATGIGLRRTRTALLTMLGRKVIESRTRCVKQRACSREEYRKVDP